MKKIINLILLVFFCTQLFVACTEENVSPKLETTRKDVGSQGGTGSGGSSDIYQ